MHVMVDFRKYIWEECRSREFRRAYADDQCTMRIALQIRRMREARGWTQKDLAGKIGTAQSVIARLENPEYGKISLQTILALAEAFDVWPTVEFVSFERGLQRTKHWSRKALNAPSFKARP